MADLKTYFSTHRQTRDALLIVVLLFLLAAILVAIGYLVTHDTNKEIFKKAQQEIKHIKF